MFALSADEMELDGFVKGEDGARVFFEVV